MRKIKMIALRMITTILLIGAGSVIYDYLSTGQGNITVFNYSDKIKTTEHYAEEIPAINYYSLPKLFTIAFENN